MFESDTAARSLIERVGVFSREENRAAAAGLVSIHDLYRLRLREDGGRDDWAIDTIEHVAAEIAAVLRISQGLATTRANDAIALGRRLPQVGAVFRAGDIDYLMFQTLVSRTELNYRPRPCGSC